MSISSGLPFCGLLKLRGLFFSLGTSSKPFAGGRAKAPPLNESERTAELFLLPPPGSLNESAACSGSISLLTLNALFAAVAVEERLAFACRARAMTTCGSESGAVAQ